MRNHLQKKKKKKKKERKKETYAHAHAMPYHALTLINPSIQVDNNIDSCYYNFRSNENNHYINCQYPHTHKQKKKKKKAYQSTQDIPHADEPTDL